MAGDRPGAEALVRNDELTVRRPRVAASLALISARAGTQMTRNEVRGEPWNDEHAVPFEMAISMLVRQLPEAEW
ncbi:MAG: hypothetical protein ACNS61_10535 [Candidatus Wenzhouxiangella sp. M2_3B_020]